jgi:HPt (histidine-containing phosphotransfer) domain-containing protein
MDGLTATRRIRDPLSPVANHGITIIAMTANAMQGDREKCIAAGMDDYISKPVTPQGLADILEKWLPQAEPPAARKSAASLHETASANDAHSDAPVFDRAGMLSRLMDDEELVSIVTDGFLGDIPKQIAKLRICVEAGDTEGTTQQAHTIKGACANVGGERMRAVAFAMERKGLDGDIEAIRTLLPTLEKEFGQLKQAMTSGRGDADA